VGAQMSPLLRWGCLGLLLVSAAPLALLGRQFQLPAHQRFASAFHVWIGDGDAGLGRAAKNCSLRLRWVLHSWQMVPNGGRMGPSGFGGASPTPAPD